jgi:hypothetical protein
MNYIYIKTIVLIYILIMSDLFIAYRHLFLATHKLVTKYSPNVKLTHLDLKKNSSDKKINLTINELVKYYETPEYSHLFDNKKKK